MTLNFVNGGFRNTLFQIQCENDKINICSQSETRSSFVETIITVYLFLEVEVDTRVIKELTFIDVS